jgi:hypothetical protein
MAYSLQPITITADTTLDRDVHGEAVILIDDAAGLAVTLPDATGSGLKFHLIVKTTITSNSTTIKTPDADNVMTGTAIIGQDAADTAVLFETASTSDTITLNGSTTGGLQGDSIELIDIAANLWFVRMVGAATGIEVTPFSATVS